MTDVEQIVRETLRETLALPRELVASFKAETPLFGALPELDSMAVATLLTELEDRLHFVIDDDEFDGEILATFGNLVSFAATKVN